jgi:hypothetical protein
MRGVSRTPPACGFYVAVRNWLEPFSLARVSKGLRNRSFAFAGGQGTPAGYGTRLEGTRLPDSATLYRAHPESRATRPFCVGCHRPWDDRLAQLPGLRLWGLLWGVSANNGIARYTPSLAEAARKSLADGLLTHTERY